MLPLHRPPGLATRMVISPRSPLASAMLLLPPAPVTPGPVSRSSLSPVLATKARRSLQPGLHHPGPGLPWSRSPRPWWRHARVTLPWRGPGRRLSEAPRRRGGLTRRSVPPPGVRPARVTTSRRGRTLVMVRRGRGVTEETLPLESLTASPIRTVSVCHGVTRSVMRAGVT